MRVLMLPEDSGDPDRLHFRVEGAACKPVLTPRCVACDAGRGATLIVYRPFGNREGSASEATGELLVRWLAGQ